MVYQRGHYVDPDIVKKKKNYSKFQNYIILNDLIYWNYKFKKFEAFMESRIENGHRECVKEGNNLSRKRKVG